MMKTNSSVFHFAIIFMLILETKIQLTDESEFLVDRSESSLFHVPKNLSLKTTILNISQNYISELRTSDIVSLSKLRILIVSHNRIQYLDISVFKFNQELEYLDLSHNELWKISCHPTVNLKHLDLSFNAFVGLPICKEFGNMSQLEFLGLSATQLQKSSVLPIASLHISKVLLVLGDTYGEKEDPESLQNFNIESLHIIFPTRKEFSFILDVSVSTAVSLELSNIKCVLDDNGCSYFQNVLLKLQNNSRLSNLTLNNIETTWNFFIMIIQLVWHTSIKYFSISNVKLQGHLDFRDFDYSNTSLKAFSIHQVVTDVFSFPQSYIYEIFSNMNVQNFTVSGTHMVHMVCPSQISTFLYLDFSNNLLTDVVFKNCGNLANLETLSLQMNQLKELASIVYMTKEMKSLQQLDVSQNSLRYDKNEGDCSWTTSLLSLNMSSNILTDSVFRCLPPKIKVLDLHNNQIRSIPKPIMKLEALQELNVASNSLAHLPDCGAFSSLSVLIIDHNSISNPSADFFHSCQKIRSIRAGNNPFQCGHDSVWVKSELLPNLEKEDLRICLHERNFVPGKSIVENIINCIEKSYKSIFVLSPNFVQSEWCHYELYFAHHNLFHEAFDNLILILLEPIPQYSIPSSYHKLKNLMARRTYLEWPKEKSKHGLFWANLRAAINIKLMEQAK
uniref:toll-like receptor 1 n=1 Tax=Panthera onca TaxID=9690 RepID=UPI00295480DD|nr:toll-like receptor 1 [Panthera onca]